MRWNVIPRVIGVSMPLLVSFSLPKPARAQACSAWERVNPVWNGEALYGVGFGNGTFVVVGDNQTILTSSNGTDWTPRNPLTYGLLQAVAYGGGRFVIVGPLGRILTSPDAATWSSSWVGGEASGDNLQSIAWTGSQFVATASWGRVITSPDGQTWTVQQTGSRDYLNAVAWGAGKLVAVGDSGVIKTSPDGVTWTLQSSWLAPNQLRGIVWGGSQFVAVGDAGTILTSPDGVTWQSRNSGTSDPLYGIAWNGKQYVAVGHVDSASIAMILTSSDGVSWLQTRIANETWLRAVAWGAGQFIAVGGVYKDPTIRRSVCGPVGGSPVAGFSWSPLNPLPGQAIQFTDTSTGLPTTWSWDFGDGSTSTQQNPTHTYASEGAKTVSLTVSNQYGSNSTSKQVTVSAAATATLTVTSANPSSGVSIAVTPTDSTGQGNGTTPFSRTYAVGTSVTLAAASTAACNVFQKWQMNGADLTTNTQVTVAITSAATMAATYTAPPQLDLRASVFNVSNVTQYGSHFNLWIDVTDSGGNAVDPALFDLSIVSDASPCAPLAEFVAAPPGVPPPSGKRWQTEFVIKKPDPVPGPLWFEGARLKILRKSDNATLTLPASSFDLAVYGTDFDVGTHAYSFPNGSWADKGVLTQDMTRAANTVALHVFVLELPMFYRDFGSIPVLNSISGLVPSLCYGMAASAIANFVHHKEADYWGEHCPTGQAYCPYNYFWDNSWNTAIATRGSELASGQEPAPNRPLPSVNVFEDSGTQEAPSLETVKKILYYYAAQKCPLLIGCGSTNWPNGDTYTDFSWQALRDLLKGHRPALFLGGHHAIVVTSAIKFAIPSKDQCNVFAYDNNFPFSGDPQDTFGPLTSLQLKTCETKSLKGQTFGRLLKETGFPPTWTVLDLGDDNGQLLPWNAGDSQWIYGSPRPVAAAGVSDVGAEASATATPSTTGLSDAERQLLLDRGYARVVLFGIETVTVVREGTTATVPLIAGGDFDGTHGVIQSVPGGYLSTVYLPSPAGVRYRVTATKMRSSPVLLAFVDVPAGPDSLDAVGYESLEISPTDATTVAFWVGPGNTDHGVARTSGAGANDTVAPSFVTTATLAVPVVNDFAAVHGDSGVNLTWRNPTHPGFASVVIVRSTEGPASSPTAGTVVYQGTAQAATDASPGTGTVFYTAFSRDGSGAATASTWLELNLGAWCISGTAATQSGSTVPGAAINVTTPAGTPLVTETDAAGHYSVCNLSAGAYAIAASAAGYTFQSSPRSVSISRTSVVSDFMGVDAATLAVTSPVGGEQWVIGSVQYIGWQAHAIAGNVTAKLSRDGGTSWEVLGATAAGDRALVWTVTGPSSTNCLVRVAGPSDQPVALSNQPFAIEGSFVASRIRRHILPSCVTPLITVPPQSKTISSGQTAALSVTATGTAPLHYQWYQGNASATSHTVGSDSASFTTPALTATTSYWVRVSNACNHADSATATVNVQAVATNWTINVECSAAQTTYLTGSFVISSAGSFDQIVIVSYWAYAGPPPVLEIKGTYNPTTRMIQGTLTQTFSGGDTRNDTFTATVSATGDTGWVSGTMQSCTNASNPPTYACQQTNPCAIAVQLIDLTP